MSRIPKFGAKPTNGPQEILRMPLSSRPKIRRSKSTSDLRTPMVHTLGRPRVLSTKNVLSDINSKNKPEPFVKPGVSKPKVGMKRPAEAPGNHLKNKVKKMPKVPDWDYKTRFGLLNEEFNSLREELKKNETLAADFQVLSSENEELRSKLEVVGKKLFDTKLEFEQSQKRCGEFGKKLEETTTDLTDCRLKLKEAEERIGRLEKEKLDFVQEKKEWDSLRNRLEEECGSFRAECKKLHEDNANLEREMGNLKDKVFEGDVMRRKLHNTIQDIKGNIRVFCRLRPPLTSSEKNTMCTFRFPSERTIEVVRPNASSPRRGTPNVNDFQEFAFDKTFDVETMQEEVFEEISQLVQSALDGYHVCVFAYGQTGSGKTYTMQGEPTDDKLGMIPRSIKLIFDTKETLEGKGWTCKIQASFLEIYNETIRDLLDMKSGKQLDIRYNEGKGTTVTNLTILPISSADELTEKMAEAQRNRSTAVTNFNEHSSRSHAVTKIYIEARFKERDHVLMGSVSLVDLAGSESAKAVPNERLAETKNINKSLSNLGNVMMALHKKESHVPFRNSKLTYLLQSSLGGNCKCSMIVNICPDERCYNETINALRFASKVKEVKTGTTKNKIGVLL